MGAPPEVIEAAVRGAAAQDFELFEDNVLPAGVFEAMTTQWRRTSMDGSITGLDYGVLPFVMRMCGVALGDRPAIFRDVRMMEMETLRVAAEKR